MTAQPMQRLASGTYLEGLAYDHARDIVWYSDVAGGGVHGVRPDGTVVATLNPERMWTGGVLLDHDGAVLSSGQGGIMWNDPDSGKSGWLISEIDGEPINGINEMAPDSRGGIFFGTVDLESVTKVTAPRSTAIFCLSSDRLVTKLCDGIGFTNGMMYDAARARFYCNDTFTGTWAFDVSSEQELTNKHMLLKKDDVDGMTLDADGNLWITGFRSSFITRLTPDGVRLADLELGAGPITQVRFGGRDMRDLYFNTVSPDGGAALKDGGEIAGKSSYLVHRPADTWGMALALPSFRFSRSQ